MLIDIRAHVTPNLFAGVMAQIEARAENAIREVAEVGQKSAKALVSGPSPSRPGEPPGIITGNLRDHITILQASRLHWILLSAARSPQGAPYPLYLEMGTWKMAARPYMRPTAYTLVKIAPGIVQRAMGG